MKKVVSKVYSSKWIQSLSDEDLIRLLTTLLDEYKKRTKEQND